ncbi:MAG: DegT/DnrJ/EryC1/StrS family aminotransferase [Kiritimatiellae bacterium]|nr:DegT/DnrJ/EryC1/StrS family aminotransferase [Kiritimatiellia bacterium]
MQIPVCNPLAAYLAQKSEIDAAVARVLDGGWYILGTEVQKFEEEFARYLGVQHAIGVANGTEALQIALLACGIGQGDMVLTVSHTAVATVAAIELTGARPVLVDVDSSYMTMDPDSLQNGIEQLARENSSARSVLKAVIPVHLYGQPADMTAISEIARKHGLAIIEDCAQSHGASFAGQRTGTFGDMAAFSFYPTKNLGALGDGGMVVTNNHELAERARLIRQYGWRDRYVSTLQGLNSRLDELQAAILRVKLSRLDADNERRRIIAAQYGRELARIPDLILPRTRPGATHVYHQYVIRASRRDELQAFLKQRGIGTQIHYPIPVHQQPAYRHVRVMGVNGLERTERLCREILSLPMYPQLSDEEVQRVTGAITEWSAQVVGKTR